METRARLPTPLVHHRPIVRSSLLRQQFLVLETLLQLYYHITKT